MRKKLIAGNWKMNKTVPETENLLRDLKNALQAKPVNGVDILVCPPFTSLVPAKNALGSGARKIYLGAQNMSEHDDGAYTGEISVGMLKAAGCEYVILGHSERRQYFKESDELINKKAKKALSAGLNAILCVGETLAEREGGITNEVLTKQAKGVLFGLSAAEMEHVVIAYEPVWAIGTGKTATSEQANDAHKLIRGLVAGLFGAQAAGKVVIQYGGSVNAGNAAQLLHQSDIDGALVGGASLKVDSFMSIIEAGV
jgi:triosephosphate isomerase